MRASSSAVRGPVVSQPERSVSATASISSSVIAGGWKERKSVRLVEESSGIRGEEAYAVGGGVRPRQGLSARVADREHRAGTVGAPPQRREDVAGLAVDPDPRGRPPGPPAPRPTRAPPPARRGTASPRRRRARRPRPARAGRRARRRSRGRSGRHPSRPRRARRRGHRRGGPRPRSPSARRGRREAACRTARSRSRARRPRPRDLGHPGAWHRTGPDVRERDAERGRLGDQPVGDRERREDAADREADHRHLGPVDELLDERQPVPRRTRARSRSPPGSSAGSATSVSPFWPCRSGALTTTGPATSGTSSSPPTTHERGCGTPASREPLALAELVRRQDRRLGRDRVRQPSALGDPRGDADGPVGAGRDDPVDLERSDEPLDRGLVLGREDAAAVGEAGSPGAPGSRSTTAVQTPRALRGLEQSELCGTGP